MTGDTILVTGARGFIGRAVTQCLLEDGYAIRGTSRRPVPPGSGNDARVQYRELDLYAGGPKLDGLLAGVDAVVHLAAHMHVDGLRRIVSGRFHQVNALGTQRLAAEAVRCGVRRFIFMSSIGVNGDQSPQNGGTVHRFNENDGPHPNSAYARSKFEAEQRLRWICAGSSLECTILRAPLVFGAGVIGSFRQLLHGIAAGLPWPVRDVRAERSMVYVENLADLVAQCVKVPAAANALFLLADFDVAVPDLIRRLAGLMD
ncbi:MAG: NAD-dependent epimerase/dehydratase family protein, partial [Burkholderiales bacterium]